MLRLVSCKPNSRAPFEHFAQRQRFVFVLYSVPRLSPRNRSASYCVFEILAVISWPGLAFCDASYENYSACCRRMMMATAVMYFFDISRWHAACKTKINMLDARIMCGARLESPRISLADLTRQINQCIAILTTQRIDFLTPCSIYIICACGSYVAYPL